MRSVPAHVCIGRAVVVTTFTQFVSCNTNSVGHQKRFHEKTSLGNAEINNIYSLQGFEGCALPCATQMFIHLLLSIHSLPNLELRGTRNLSNVASSELTTNPGNSRKCYLRPEETCLKITRQEDG